MDWKEFFKPTAAKVALFLILMGGLNYLIIFSTTILDGMMLAGWPFGFWPVGSYMAWPGYSTLPAALGFSPVNFAIDLIFWYLVSCGIVALYLTIRKK